MFSHFSHVIFAFTAKRKFLPPLMIFVFSKHAQVILNVVDGVLLNNKKLSAISQALLFFFPALKGKYLFMFTYLR